MNSLWLDAVTETLRQRVLQFLFTFFVSFTLLYITFTAFQAVPAVVIADVAGDETVAATTTVAKETPVEQSVSDELAPLPLTLTIDKYERTLTVLNPESRAVADLDAALLEGVVRHPDSATLREDGSVFILGHSSYLPTVHNKNFQAFNGVQNLEWGDTVRINSGDTEYVYRVERVYKARATDVEVPIAGDHKRLVLATCNSFGSKDDRFIVEAELVSESTK